MKKHHPKYWDVAVFLVSASLLLVVGSHNGVVDINNNLFGNNVFFYLFSGFCGSLMILSISKILSEFLFKPTSFDRLGKAIYGFINIFAKGLLLVVGFSAILSSFYREVIIILIPSLNTNSNLFGLILGGAVLFSFYPLTIICQKFFPAILGFRK